MDQVPISPALSDSPAGLYGKTQHQRFVEKARELGAEQDAKVFRRVVRTVATAPTKKVKKAAKKRKR